MTRKRQLAGPDINTAYGCLVCLHSRLPGKEVSDQRCALGHSTANGRKCGSYEPTLGRFNQQEGRV